VLQCDSSTEHVQVHRSSAELVQMQQHSVAGFNKVALLSLFLCTCCESVVDKGALATTAEPLCRLAVLQARKTLGLAITGTLQHAHYSWSHHLLEQQAACSCSSGLMTPTYTASEESALAAGTAMICKRQAHCFCRVHTAAL
jgi:hypothetical protein